MHISIQLSPCDDTHTLHDSLGMFCPVSLDDTSEIQPVLLALLKLSSTLASHRGWESDVAAERMGMKHPCNLFRRDRRESLLETILVMGHCFPNQSGLQ